jgi:Bacterial SH3 domain
VTRIIRLGLCGALGLLLVAACTFNPPSTPGTASAGRQVVTEPSPTVNSKTAVWVVSAVGLNMHSSADVNATRVATVGQGVRLDISERTTVGPDTWLHVKSEGGTEGWVLDQPDLVIHRQVSQHVEPSGWSILFPAEWSPVSGNPATFTGGSGAGGGSMLVQTAPDPTQLMPTPISTGHELRQESPIEVYGRTTYLTVYKLDAGGFEYDVKAQFPKTKVAYLFDFKDPSGTGSGDTSLFKQLLDSVIVPGEG